MIEYCKATINDYEEVMDLADFVFSYAYTPHNFVKMLPKLYAKDNFELSSHFIAKEDGRIKAVVGSYPMEYSICGQTLKTAGIGMVSVHHNCRSKGYMKKLMAMALDDMAQNNVDISCLGGLRQRYEYFGYAHTGAAITFNCNTNNIRHKFGNENFGLILKEITESTEIDKIYHLHHAKKAFIIRNRKRMFSIMQSWGDKVIGVWQNGELQGYFVCSENYDSIFELTLNDASLVPEIIGVFLQKYNRYDVRVQAFPHEPQTVSQLSSFAENFNISDCGHFNVLNYPKVLTALLKLKSAVTHLPDGEITICVKDKCCFKISAANNEPTVVEVTDEPDITLSHLDAMNLLFSPMTPFDYSIAQNSFLRGLLPVPLFIEKSDRV